MILHCRLSVLENVLKGNMQVLQKLDERLDKDVYEINYGMNIWSRISVLLISIIWWFYCVACSTKLRVIILEIISASREENILKQLSFFI